MTRYLAITGLLLLATPAYAEETAPDAGSFGLGAFFLTNPALGGLASFTPGVTGTFWATDQLTVSALLGLDAIENRDAHFLIMIGADYYVLKVERFGAFVGGNLGININPLTTAANFGNNSNTQVLFRLEGGGEYFASEHLGIFVSPGLAFQTEPTYFGFTTMLGARVYY